MTDSLSFRIIRRASPTSTLPPLTRLQDHTSQQVQGALQNLRLLYWPSPSIARPPKLPLQKHTAIRTIYDDTVPDSGYASAEEEELDAVGKAFRDKTTHTIDSNDGAIGDDCDDDVEALRFDAVERAFSIKWIIGFISRSDAWISSSPDEDESNARADVVEYASEILSFFAGGEKAEAVTRRFSFPLQNEHSRLHTAIDVELNDAPLLTEDHTSVGLQSWASSIILAEKICKAPTRFGLAADTTTRLRVLELGAGTGLLSITTAKLLQYAGYERSVVVATDYHPDVLKNLNTNVQTNFSASLSPPVHVYPLDWAHPEYSALPEKKFDIMLAADVIYHPEHAQWIKGCIERFLARPVGGKKGGICWLIMPLRLTGRHQQMDSSVESVFPSIVSAGARVGTTASYILAILQAEEVERHRVVGRADESGYKIFKIGWVSDKAICP